MLQNLGDMFENDLNDNDESTPPKLASDSPMYTPEEHEAVKASIKDIVRFLTENFNLFDEEAAGGHMDDDLFEKNYDASVEYFQGLYPHIERQHAKDLALAELALQLGESMAPVFFMAMLDPEALAQSVSTMTGVERGVEWVSPTLDELSGLLNESSRIINNFSGGHAGE